jgi:Fe-S-cluster containining protein
MDFSSLAPVFESYERLRAEADALFERIRAEHGECVSCRPGCCDCCHAFFDLSLVEALYLNQAFNRAFPFGPEHSEVLAAADGADRKAVRIKRALYTVSKEGDEQRVMDDAARARLRCPLLDAEDRCRLYEHRPVTCRLYGVPAAVGGEARVCGKTAFVKGRPYPTVALEKIQDRLADMSRELARILNTRLKELHLVYVPVSSALLTRYDAEYLGLSGTEDRS